MAIQRAELLIGSYRSAEMSDPKIYALAVADVLSAYPEDVVRRVTAPRTGLAGRLKWVPSVAEVKEACEAEMAPVYREQARREAVERLRLLPPPIDRSARKTIAELNEELAKRGLPLVCQNGRNRDGLSPKEEKALHEAKLEQLKAKAEQPSGLRASDELLALLSGKGQAA